MAFEKSNQHSNEGRKPTEGKGHKNKTISLKVLAPLLEECLLEADENLQTKWASLLANTLAENSTIKTNIFTSTLKEMTTEDAEIFEVIFERCTICTQTEKEIEIIHSGRATSPDAFKGYPDMI